jgi:hypothetical protein
MQQNKMKDAYWAIQGWYTNLIKDEETDKDLAGYILPQGLRKAFIMHANVDDWNYILNNEIEPIENLEEDEI